MPPVGSENALQALVRSAFFIAASLLLSVSSALASEHCSSSGKLEKVAVSRVYDGDTLKLVDGRKLRLIGVNASEMGHQGKPDQPMAMAATQAVKAFVQDSSQLLIQTDSQQQDRYGRLLAHLFNERGENLEQQLLEQGLAYHVAVTPNLTLASCLARAELRARVDGIGLWGPNGITPVAAADVSTGGFQRVQGKVTELSLGKLWRLKLDNYLVAITYPEHQNNFEHSWYQALLGQSIEIQGWVYRSRGEWRVKLETPFAVDRLPLAMTR